MLFYVIQLLNYYILYKAIKQGSWLSTSQRAGILPITFITPILKPGPTHIALSNRQTLLAGRQAGTESTICRSMNTKKHLGTLD